MGGPGRDQLPTQVAAVCGGRARRVAVKWKGDSGCRARSAADPLLDAEERGAPTSPSASHPTGSRPAAAIKSRRVACASLTPPPREGRRRGFPLRSLDHAASRNEQEQNVLQFEGVFGDPGAGRVPGGEMVGPAKLTEWPLGNIVIFKVTTRDSLEMWPRWTDASVFVTPRVA